MAKGFTFFESYYQAAQKMSESERTVFYLGLIEYAFEGKPLTSDNRILDMAFDLAKPSIDKSMRDRENGGDGGRRHKKDSESESEKPPLQAPLRSPPQKQEKRRGLGENTDLERHNICALSESANVCVESERMFNAFYSAYPRKKDRKRALKAWIDKHIDEPLFKTIMRSLEAHKRNDPIWGSAIIRGDFNYIPYPTRFIQDERWNDEL